MFQNYYRYVQTAAPVALNSSALNTWSEGEKHGEKKIKKSERKRKGEKKEM